MKFFKAFVVVLLLVATVLTLISVFVPEVDDSFEIVVDRPLITVFAGVMNTQQLPEWVGGLDRIERSEGFLAMPGSEFKLYYSGNETETVYTLEVLEMIPLQSVKFKLYNEMTEFTISMNFIAENGSTKIDSYVQMKGKGFVSKAFLPLMKSVIMNVGRENLETFKELQEK